MRTEEEVKEFLEEVIRNESLNLEQIKIIGRTLRWVLGLTDRVIL